MTSKRIAEQHHATFESIRQHDAVGNEYGSARKLAKVLEYSEYRHFQSVIERARDACQGSGYVVADHFEDVLEMVDIGSGAKRELPDVRLSRYACYLIEFYQGQTTVLWTKRIKQPVVRHASP